MKKLLLLLMLTACPAFAQTPTPAPTALETVLANFPTQQEVNIGRVTVRVSFTKEERAEFEKRVPSAIQNQCTPLIQKYKDMTKLIKRDTVKQHIEMIRAKLLIDVPYWKMEAERSVIPMDQPNIKATAAQRAKIRNDYADRLLKNALSHNNYNFVAIQMPHWLSELEDAAK